MYQGWEIILFALTWDEMREVIDCYVKQNEVKNVNSFELTRQEIFNLLLFVHFFSSSYLFLFPPPTKT